MSFDAPSRPFRKNEKVIYAADPHRAQPADIEAEQGVLCSYVLNPREVGSLIDSRRIGLEHFYIPAHQIVFDALEEMRAKGKPIDIVTLTTKLHDRDELDSAGGGAMISNLFTFLPTAMNVEYYMETLIDKRSLRQAIEYATEISVRAYHEQDDVAGLLDDIERKALAIRPKALSKTVVPAREAVMDALTSIAEMYERRGAIGGLSTGLPDLDLLIDGLQAEMIVIAARPSVGKTALAMNIAEFIAVELQKPIAVFSLEMSRRQLMHRLICSRARVNLKRVREGRLHERDFQALTIAGGEIANSKLFIDDSSDLTIQELRAKARRLKQEHGIEAIFIDYLQLLRSTTKQAQEKREREVSDCSSGCKAMAKELDIPVVVLAQIARDAEKRGPQSRPRLSDLRESGSIEQDADTVGFLTREEFFAETEEERREALGLADLFIAKQRMGPRGNVPLTFINEFTRFESRITGDHDEADGQSSLALE